MSLPIMALYILVMAGVTYLIRMLPMVFFRKKIKSQYILSLLHYIPYAVLSAMTFPQIFYTTGDFWSALVGTIVAIIASICKLSLIIVALLACLFVLAASYLIPLII